MIDRDVVERFARAVGAGSVTYIAPREAHHKPQWQWMSTNYEVVQWLVIRFWPLLGERRREQAKRALQTIQEYKQEIAARRKAA